MKFSATRVAGAFVIDLEPIRDSRGFFARTFDAREFRSMGLPSRFVQCSVSFNAKKGTLRGMHYQVSPSAETKLVRCTRGRVYDVIIDLRPRSPTRDRWHACELSAENRRIVCVPPGVAHGFLTLEAGSELYYEMSRAHSPARSRGVRWDDPAFGVRWPASPSVISARDRTYPDRYPVRQAGR